MSRRYTYSRTIHTREGAETFTADQFDSFDEAQKVVDKGIHERKLELDKKYPPVGNVDGAKLGEFPGHRTGGSSPLGSVTDKV